MKVLLTDDHPLFLDGLEDLLASHGFEVVGTARRIGGRRKGACAAPRRDPDGYSHAAARWAGRCARDQGGTARNQNHYADDFGN